MSKLVTVFCESFSDKYAVTLNRIVDKFNFRPRFIFIALTPMACYQLGKLSINYSTPEMYCKVPDVKFDPYKEQNVRLRIFQIYKYEKERAIIYWNKFLTDYLKTMYSDRKPLILYFGKNTGLSDELKTNEILAKAAVHNINMSK